MQSNTNKNKQEQNLISFFFERLISFVLMIIIPKIHLNSFNFYYLALLTSFHEVYFVK